MRKILLMLLATILMSGCAPGGAEESDKEGTEEGKYNEKASVRSSRALMDDCDDTGGTHVILFYGNRRIRTAGVAHMRPGEIFEIWLKPENDLNNRPGIDYETETVTISGKDLASVWLTAVGTYDSTPAPHHELVICVPLGTPKGDYFYNIDITETGSLDPRADVY